MVSFSLIVVTRSKALYHVLRLSFKIDKDSLPRKAHINLLLNKGICFFACFLKIEVHVCHANVDVTCERSLTLYFYATRFSRAELLFFGEISVIILI